MQKLEERNTYTPTDIPQVRGDCGLSLNIEETLSVSGLKTSPNNSDAALTATKKGHAGQDLRVPAVYVLNMRGKPLMPTTPRKARKNHATGEPKQEIVLGVDSGYEKIGLSAKTNKKEVYSAEVKLRDDIVKLNSERRQYRRTRRTRKTWYRQPRFLNRKKPEGWLAPSLRHNRKLFKGDRSHIKNTAERYIHRFQRFDKVLWNGIECFIFGRRKTGYFDLRKLDGTKIHASAKAKELVLKETVSTLLIERTNIKEVNREGGANSSHPFG